jgi:hypothetical protein
MSKINRKVIEADVKRIISQSNISEVVGDLSNIIVSLADDVPNKNDILIKEADILHYATRNTIISELLNLIYEMLGE